MKGGECLINEQRRNIRTIKKEMGEWEEVNFIDEEKLRYVFLSIIIILELIVIGVVVMKDTGNAVDEVPKKVIVSKIKVDVKGAVKKEGVYELEEGARISDLIKVAGGLKSNASTKYLNLSKKLTDEMVVKVYTDKQIKNMNITYTVQEECKCSTEDISDCAGASTIIKGEESSSSSTNKVSLNKATKEELMTLSGVGESKALAIIKYREDNNGFNAIEDIMNVSGIGESLYNKIKDFITL